MKRRIHENRIIKDCIEFKELCEVLQACYKKRSGQKNIGQLLLSSHISANELRWFQPRLQLAAALSNLL